MIMDEVLAVGDMAFQKKCLDKMRDAAKKEGRTVLYVSHNMNTIRQLCDRCVVLDKGKVIFEGDVETAIAIYMGSRDGFAVHVDCRDLPRENICDGQIRIETIEMIGADIPAIYEHNPLKLRFRYWAGQEYSQLLFRMIIFSVNAAPIGMVYSNDYIHSCSGMNSVDLQFDLDVLSPGEYSCRMVFYEVNEYGGEAIHDVVDKVFRFRKYQHDEISDTTVSWKSHVWGNVCFPGAIVDYEEH
jgi:lipopolysaccharide transport system ATP-binding protein